MIKDPSLPPAVSVVLPAYNRAGSIRAAVNSVLRQSFTDLELLVVDDGSTDGTMAALQGLDDPRLRLLANPRNLGAGAARNTGIEAARADWVAFQDSDDEWLPEKLAKQMACLAAAPPATVAVYCGMAVVLGGDEDRNGRTRLRYIPNSDTPRVAGDLLSALWGENLVSTQTLIARRQALRACGGFDASLPALEDWDCAIRLARLGPFAFVDEPLVMQRFSANSLTRDMGRRLAARQQIAEKHRHALAAERPGELATYYRKIAGEQRRLGQYRAARASLGRARALAPLDLRLWLLTGLVWLQGLAPSGVKE